MKFDGGVRHFELMKQDSGVPFLSHAEDRLVRQKWAEREAKVYDEEVKAEESQFAFLESVRKDITNWLENSNVCVSTWNPTLLRNSQRPHRNDYKLGYGNRKQKLTETNNSANFLC